MKRILMLLVTLMLLATSYSAQAGGDEAEQSDEWDPENPPEGYGYWDATGQFCPLYHVYAAHPQLILNPLLGVLQIDPDDCYIVTVQTLVTKVTYYIETS